LSISLQAYGKALPSLAQNTLGKITYSSKEGELRGDYILAMSGSAPAWDLLGYAGVLIVGDVEAGLATSMVDAGVPVIYGLSTLAHLQEGDIVALQPSGYVRTLYRVASNHNAIFTTDRCNSFCLMCSQPPRPIHDEDRIAEHLRLLDLIESDPLELGVTGGEPTLLKNDLIRLIERCKERLPNTALHVLSNGRMFYYGSFAKRIAEIGHPDLVFGIPLYSDIDFEHDYVVQAPGAFGQTLIGLQNLGRYGVPVEIRVVIHKLTYHRLPNLAEFIYRNVPFAAHVALMGLEVIGFAVPNLKDLWVDPADCRNNLTEATKYLVTRGLNVSIYNHQLCTVPQELWGYCRRSISDWKNEYLPVCAECVKREACGGFFQSSLGRKYSSSINPILSS
jgi:His-Xaa-Ser system radical SAM maturase HxsC